ncbi:hypothetical protein CP971_25590 [Streptomyces viridifaciens]|nr:hypothetical protein CP971_25590 [Streptomyces viridifaciens]
MPFAGQRHDGQQGQAARRGGVQGGQRRQGGRGRLARAERQGGALGVRGQGTEGQRRGRGGRDV